MTADLAPGVYVREVESGSRPIEGVGTATAAFLGFAEDGPYNEPTLVTNWKQYTDTFGGIVPDYYLGQAVYGYLLNGGTSCYVVRLGTGGRAGVEPSAPAAPPSAILGAYRVLARTPVPPGGSDNGHDGQNGGQRISVAITDPPEGAGEDKFSMIVSVNNVEAERFDGVTTGRGRENVVNVVQSRSRLVLLEQQAEGQVVRPPSGEVVLVAPEPEPAPAEEGVTEVYVGDSADRTGFGGLEAIDDVTMVAVPDLMGAYQRGSLTLDAVHTVQRAMIDHCELMGDRMAILDAPPELPPQKAARWRQAESNYSSKFAVLYYPWIAVGDQRTGGARLIPPSGHVAGVWARNDATRGVHKAPANEVIRGVVDLEIQLTATEQAKLNPIGVNCIRAFPGRGIRIWGARTLAPADSEWRYLNVRRLFNYLEESILTGTQWVVFEPNEPALWARIRRTIGAFLVNEWRKGALFGLTPDEAFFVQCDQSTNTRETIELGQVVCRVGVAPVKPAEFVMFELTQLAAGVSVVNE